MHPKGNKQLDAIQSRGAISLWDYVKSFNLHFFLHFIGWKRNQYYSATRTGKLLCDTPRKYCSWVSACLFVPGDFSGGIVYKVFHYMPYLWNSNFVQLLRNNWLIVRFALSNVLPTLVLQHSIRFSNLCKTTCLRTVARGHNIWFFLP